MVRLSALLLLTAVAVAAAAPAESARRPPRGVQQALLQEILRAIPDTRITGKVGAPTRDWGVNRHASFARSSWLYFKLRPRDVVEHVQQSWQADIAEGLLAGISKSRGWRPVTGSSITVVLPDGRERFDSGSARGGAFRGGIDHLTEAEAERDLRASAARVGAEVETLRFPRPLGRLAAEVVVVTDRPSAFADRSRASVWAIIEPVLSRLEGVYIEVRARDGRWVAALGTSTRGFSTISTVNPDFR